MPSRVAAAPPSERSRLRAELPDRWFWLMKLFRGYARRYVRNHFHALRISQSGGAFPPPGDDPLLIVLNHPSWWDPLVAMVLATMLAEHDHFAVIDERALQRYAFFRKLGFVGLETNTTRGAIRFLHSATTILSQSRRALWVTAQGRFSDVRERPLSFLPGVGHLAARLSRGVIVPIALEYAFWWERTPEVLVRIGRPIRIEESMGATANDWLARIETESTRNLDSLNAETIARDPARFRTILEGRCGVGGPYDLWLRLKKWFAGKQFDPSHGAAMQEGQL